MNYTESGEGLGPQAEQISMNEATRQCAKSAFFRVIVHGLTRGDIAELGFPVWESDT